MTTIRRRFFYLQSLTAASLMLSLFVGMNSLPHETFQTILLTLRLPRALTAFTAGALLSLSGALIQLLLQNPLADPYVLGVSSGAAFFTLLMMLLGVQGDWLVLGAWAGSLLSAGLVVMLARHHRWQIHTLLLSGMALAGGFAAGISLILLLSPDTSLHSMLFWLMGDLNDASISLTSFVILIAATLIAYLMAPALNILARGEKEARALGLPVERYRFFIFLLSALCAAAAVTIAGCIGFVGLIVPHFARRIFTCQHRIMLPAAVLCGGTLVVLADTLSRTLFAPVQIPVGIVLAFIGIPIFIGLIRP